MRKARTEAERYRESVPALLQWYSYNARVLPWREEPTPYHVWISEIMLQQTRVEAVRAYYERFLQLFPDVQAVASASEDRLVKAWEGLGYYSRIRNIHAAAQVICEQYGGELPADYELLRNLPGIGDYTAGAIASMAFGLSAPAVDGNVLRVYARLTGYREDIRSPKYKKQVTEGIADALAAWEQSEAGRVNQAIMDIGATVCIPNGKPHCDVCPLSHLCAAYAEDLTEEIPMKTAKKSRPVQKKTVLVIRCGNRYLLHRRPRKGLLAGMWEFPNEEGHLTAKGAKDAVVRLLSEMDGFCREAAGAVRKQFGIESNETAMRSHRLPDGRHVFSHIEWDMRGYRVELADPGQALTCGEVNPDNTASDYVWATAAEITERFGLPQAFQTYKLQL